ncbi:MAG TPA: VOC family protein [Beijerinckiaceae bacterium]|nr:VOC family protein [Beijerinckiaceae bacterium]
MRIEAYLFFDGRSEEAIEFYRRALGAEQTMLVRFKDGPDASMIPPGGENKVMHARLRIGETVILMSDGHCGGTPNFQGFSLSITAKDEAEADRIFAAHAEGGEVGMPLGKTFFSPRFGMLTDRFGVGWMVITEH